MIMTTTTPATLGDKSRLEICCPGCDRTESIDVDTTALAAYRSFELNERQAFPEHTFDEQTLIECGWHVDCWDNAVHGHHR
jgi:hypothetical protein